MNFCKAINIKIIIIYKSTINKAIVLFNLWL